MLAGFLDRACVAHAQASVSVEALYEAYRHDIAENGDEGLEPPNKIVFSKRLKSRSFTQDKATGGVREWRGIGLVAPRGKNPVSSTQGRKYSTNP